MYPMPGRGWEEPGPSGFTYAAVLLSGADRSEVLGALREIRFSGWVAPDAAGVSGAGVWLVVVAASGDGTVAAGRRGVLGVGEWLADRFPVPVLVIRVVDDRQLVLAMWSDGAEIGRYVSDPSWALDDDEILHDPVGAEYADEFATACGHPEVAGDLADVLAEPLDTDRFIESERLIRVLRLLGLPGWLVTAASLPHDVVNGPPTRTLTRLRAGWAVDLVRRRRRPPPVLEDPPRAGAGPDPWLM